MIFIILQDYQEKPDYGRCVAIVASASLREMIKPGALAIISPIVIGRFFIFVYWYYLSLKKNCFTIPPSKL